MAPFDIMKNADLIFKIRGANMKTTLMTDKQATVL